MTRYRRHEAKAVDELFWERWRFRVTMGQRCTGPCSGVEMGGDDPQTIEMTTLYGYMRCWRPCAPLLPAWMVAGYLPARVGARFPTHKSQLDSYVIEKVKKDPNIQLSCLIRVL